MPPTRSNSRSCSTRSSLTWVSAAGRRSRRGRACRRRRARSGRARRCDGAGEGALLVAEELASRAALAASAAQLTLTNGARRARASCSWMARATSSLPVPVSPRDEHRRRRSAPPARPARARGAAPASEPTMSLETVARVELLAQEHVLVLEAGSSGARSPRRPGSSRRRRPSAARPPRATPPRAPRMCPPPAHSRSFRSPRCRARADTARATGCRTGPGAGPRETGCRWGCRGRRASRPSAGCARRSSPPAGCPSRGSTGRRPRTPGRGQTRRAPTLPPPAARRRCRWRGAAADRRRSSGRRWRPPARRPRVWAAASIPGELEALVDGLREPQQQAVTLLGGGRGRESVTGRQA